jgi:hypothetical protein
MEPQCLATPQAHPHGDDAQPNGNGGPGAAEQARPSAAEEAAQSRQPERGNDETGHERHFPGTPERRFWSCFGLRFFLCLLTLQSVEQLVGLGGRDGSSFDHF